MNKVKLQVFYEVKLYCREKQYEKSDLLSFLFLG